MICPPRWTNALMNYQVYTPCKIKFIKSYLIPILHRVAYFCQSWISWEYTNQHAGLWTKRNTVHTIKHILWFTLIYTSIYNKTQPMVLTHSDWAYIMCLKVWRLELPIPNFIRKSPSSLTMCFCWKKSLPSSDFLVYLD